MTGGLCSVFLFVFFLKIGLFADHITEHVWPWLERVDLRVWQMCKQFSLVNFSVFATHVKYLHGYDRFSSKKKKKEDKTEHNFDLKQSFKVQQGLNGIRKYQTLMYGCHLECIFFYRTQQEFLGIQNNYSSGGKNAWGSLCLGKKWKNGMMSKAGLKQDTVVTSRHFHPGLLKHKMCPQ